MARFTVTANSYQAVIKIMDELKSKGIDCNITVGGLTLYLTDNQVQLVHEICRLHKALVLPGVSMHVERVILQKSNADFEKLKALTDESIEMLKRASN